MILIAIPGLLALIALLTPTSKKANESPYFFIFELYISNAKLHSLSSLNAEIISAI